MKAIIVWEHGDTVEEIEVKDGVITSKDLTE